MQAALTVLEQDIPTVHPDVLISLDGVQNASVKRMLENMGVKHISSEDVIKKHVLPCFASGKWKEKSTDLLLAYVQLIKEQWTSDKQSLNMLEVRRAIQVQLTSGHFVNPQDTTVQLSVEYLSMFDLPSMFPDSVWNIVSSAYLDLSGLSSKQTTSNRQQWKMFLLALGVKEFLAVDKQEVVLKHSELDSSPWAWMKDLFPAYEGRYYIDDQVCPQFDQLTSQVDSPAKYQQMVVLLQALDGLWEAQYANYKLATVYDEDKKELKQVESSFFMNVKKLPWIPSEKGKFGAYRNRGGSIDHLEMENVLLHGSSIYIRYREIESLLGEHVPYLARGIHLKSALCKELGIQTFLSNEAILEHLREWSEASSQGQIFLTTVRHMKNVYWHFESRYTADELKELFGQNDFIFVPNEDGATYQTNAFVAGEFLPLKMVCWHDPTGLVQKYGAQGKGAGMTGQKEKYKRELAHVYHDMEAFFRGILQVMETPTMKEYVQLLQEIAEENPVPNHAATLHAYKIFEILGQKCKKKENPSGIVGQKGRGILSEPTDASNVELDSIFAGQLKHLLETADVIPTSSNKWVQIQEDPLLADDPRLAELFKKQVAEKILLVAEPVTVVSGIQQSSSEDQVTELRSRAEFFFKAVGIKTLSEGVEQEVVPESTRPSPEVQQYIHKVVPYIQQFLFSFHPTVYKKLQEKKVSAVLKLLLFYQSSKLDVVYRLRDKPRVNVTVQEKCILQNEREFYVHKDSVKSYRDMDKELVKIFLPASAQDLETGLLNFLQVLRMHIQKPDGGMTDADFQREQKMKALPEEEERWAVPEPDQLLIRPSQKTESKEHPLDDLNWTEKDEKAKKKKNPPEAGELTSWPPPPPKEKMGPPTDSERSQPQATGKPSTGSAPISEPLHLHVKDGDNHASQRAQKDHGPFSQVGTSPVLPQIQPSSGQNQVTKADSRDAPIDQGQSSSTTEDGSVGRPVDKTGQVVNQRPEQTQHVPDSVPTVQHQALPQFGVPSQFGFSVPGPQVDPSHHHQQGSQDMGSRGGESDLFSLFSSPPRSLGPALFGPGDSIEQVQYEDTTGINIETALPPVAEVLVGDKKHIGEWGEKWVNSFLQAKFREQIEKKYLVIHWVNEKQESGKPFDFCIEWIAEEKQVFIEVKSTFAENKDMFEISSQELKAAQKLKKNYQIYRVYNAGNSFQPVKLRVLENVLQLLDSKAIKMSMWL
ncbi:uncharacterized protein LOC106162632 [Lingula anatina]|uniref:Uncharacterized protein LOC106162632 n=1 Tax=Lingula anatina TaxID=7574 RepID=A0A1S3IC40_LINAN|nr:uncharacterized protein LOC106162632 [Lingula anatina]|eukprot:XP_013395426.1 uncharacterized protein LOC106162632 [Lingula anatina]